MRKVIYMFVFIVIVVCFSACNNNQLESEAPIEETDYNSTQEELVKNKIDSVKVTEEPDAEIYLMYKCETDDIALYSYVEEGFVIEGNGNNVVLKTEKGYVEYALDVYFQRMLDNELDGENHYSEGDFDNDGDVELACAFTMDTGSDYHNEKLFVFDYNGDTKEYDLYYLRFEDFADDVAQIITEHYGEGYVWSNAESAPYFDPYASDTVRMCSGKLTYGGELAYIYGNYEHVNVVNGSPFTMRLLVSKSEENYNPQIGEVVYNVTYHGMGSFEVAETEYVECEYEKCCI